MLLQLDVLDRIINWSLHKTCIVKAYVFCHVLYYHLFDELWRASRSSV